MPNMFNDPGNAKLQRSTVKALDILFSPSPLMKVLEKRQQDAFAALYNAVPSDTDASEEPWRGDIYPLYGDVIKGGK